MVGLGVSKRLEGGVFNKLCVFHNLQPTKKNEQIVYRYEEEIDSVLPRTPLRCSEREELLTTSKV